MVVGPTKIVDSKKHKPGSQLRFFERRCSREGEVGHIFRETWPNIGPPEIFFVGAGKLKGIETALGFQHFAGTLVDFQTDVKGEFRFHLFASRYDPPPGALLCLFASLHHEVESNRQGGNVRLSGSRFRIRSSTSRRIRPVVTTGPVPTRTSASGERL